MADMNQATEDDGRVWLSNKEEILTIVLAIARTQEYEPEEVWAEMQLFVKLDLQPYPNFQAMRLALEKDCDVDGYLASLPERDRKELGTCMVARDGALYLPTVDEQQSMPRLQEFRLQLGKARKCVCWNTRARQTIDMEWNADRIHGPGDANPYPNSEANHGSSGSL